MVKATSRYLAPLSRAEGLYSNMETREVLPLCSKNIKTDCFEANLRVPFRGGRIDYWEELFRVLEWGV
jgi:hypothetical protein